MPCIVWWPGVVPAASVSMAPMSGLDLFPTFLSLANRGLKTHQQQKTATTAAAAAAAVRSEGGGAAVPVLDGFDVSKVWTDPEAEPYGPWCVHMCGASVDVVLFNQSIFLSFFMHACMHAIHASTPRWLVFAKISPSAS